MGHDRGGLCVNNSVVVGRSFYCCQWFKAVFTGRVRHVSRLRNRLAPNIYYYYYHILSGAIRIMPRAQNDNIHKGVLAIREFSSRDKVLRSEFIFIQTVREEKIIYTYRVHAGTEFL